MDDVLVEVWADGSCPANPGPGGWGTIIRLLVDGVLARELQASGRCADTTNNRMEIQAVIEGLRRINRPCAVVVFSDSRYVVGTMSSGWKRRKNVDLWLALDAEVAKHSSVRFEWVRGHAGSVLNERCDALAGAA